MKKFLANLGVILLVLVLIGGYLGYDYYQMIFSANVPSNLENEYVHIPNNSSFEEVVKLLKDGGYINNTRSFEWVASEMNYVKNPMRAGRYKVQSGWSNRQLIGHLRGGQQSPVNFIIHNKRTIEQVAGVCGNLLEGDSLDYLQALTDPQFLKENGYTKQTIISAIIPNTYHLYWNLSPEGFRKRMLKEHNNFWTDARKAKAKKWNLTPMQIYTLASIVESETQANQEKSKIAGVYLNRLQKGMLLQADPTVKFAVGDFGLRRILNVHLAVESPYNTYKYAGLPPGPIYMPSVTTLDKTLNAENHDYLYFCAKPDNSGLHAFAKTLQGHNANAARFHRWLNQRNIR